MNSVGVLYDGARIHREGVDYNRVVTTTRTIGKNPGESTHVLHLPRSTDKRIKTKKEKLESILTFERMDRKPGSSRPTLTPRALF